MRGDERRGEEMRGDERRAEEKRGEKRGYESRERIVEEIEGERREERILLLFKDINLTQ